MSNSITIDTCVWLKLLDNNDSSCIKEIEELLDFCLAETIQIFYSSRVLNFDTTAMREEQKLKLEKILNKYKAKIQGSSFRFGSVTDPQKGSGLSSVFDQPETSGDFFISVFKSQDEMAFEEIFGIEPSQLPPDQTGKKLSNHIGDYDALRFHFLNKVKIFVTYDTKLYMCNDKRHEAKNKIDLLIMNPSEALLELKST